MMYGQYKVPSAETPTRKTTPPPTPVPKRRGVHNHGTEEGEGLACRESRLPDGSLQGACMNRHGLNRLASAEPRRNEIPVILGEGDEFLGRARFYHFDNGVTELRITLSSPEVVNVLNDIYNTQTPVALHLIGRELTPRREMTKPDLSVIKDAIIKKNQSDPVATFQPSGEEAGPYMTKAMSLVREHVLRHLEITDPEIPDFGVYVVWFSKVLDNWKALVSTTLPDGRYYEVTHNGVKGETYIDAYVKLRNECVKD